MMTSLRKTLLRLAAAVWPQKAQDALVRAGARPVAKQLCGVMTDAFMETLLRAMEVAFMVSGNYRRNIDGFRATYVFRTDDGRIGATAQFDGGRMHVRSTAEARYDACISFKDARALWAFLLSGNQDILDSLLANAVEVDGNLNYVYRFGFLARDLTRRLAIA